MSTLATWTAQAAAPSREEKAVADNTAIVSSRRVWTRANSALTCWAQVAQSSEGKAAPTAGIPEAEPEPARAAAARARRVASVSSLAPAGAAALGEPRIVKETARSARHSSSHR